MKNTYKISTKGGHYSEEVKGYTYSLEWVTMYKMKPIQYGIHNDGTNYNPWILTDIDTGMRLNPGNNTRKAAIKWINTFFQTEKNRNMYVKCKDGYLSRLQLLAG